ncbi:MAG: PAS domain-containing protein [Methylobacterium sp.]
MSARPNGPGSIGDTDRLAALHGYGILDTPAEQGFDDVVLLAAQICAAPTALVSFVAHDRQWFKARVGFDPCETPLDQSVCAHALGHGDILVIPDLTRDPRTRDNALVTDGPRMRFYAGAPLHTPEGATLGTLCVIDTKPRPRGLSVAQAIGLKALARQVMVQLELIRAVENRGQALAARAQAEEQMRLAADATGIGVFDFEPKSGALRWDTRVRALFGVPERAAVSYEGSFLANIHPDDRAQADMSVRIALDPAGPRMFDTEYRVLSADTGVERWLAARGQAIVVDGETVRFVGTVRDVTAAKVDQILLRETEERYRLAARATTDAIWDWNLATNEVRWNEALESAYGHAPEAVEPTGDWWIAHIHPEDRAKVDASIHALIDGTGTAWTEGYRFLRADGGFAEVLDRGYVIRDAAGRACRMIGAMLDLTRIRAAETALRDSQRQLTMERRLLSAVIQQAPVGISVTDASSAWTTLINARAEEMLGHGLGSAHTAFAASPDVLLRPDGRPYAASEVPTMRALRHGETVRNEEVRCRNATTGEIRRLEVSSAPVRSEDGVVQAAVTVLVDVEDRLLAEAEVRRLASIVEHSGDFIGFARPDGSVAWVNEAGRGMVGLGGEEIAQSTVFRDYFEAEDLGFVEAVIRPTVLREGRWQGEYRFRSFTGAAPTPVFLNLFALRGPDGSLQGIATVARDITERRRAEERQALLNHELSHRMKNLLAMVQSITTLTLRGASDIAQARDVLLERIVSLGKAHDLLLGGASDKAMIVQIVRAGIGLHDEPGGDGFAYDGPDIEIGRDASLSLSLMLHELATNAAKYGALSAPGGRVAVSWGLVGDPASPDLRIAWRESGGPPVVPPSRKGFGSRLIERGITGQVGGTLTLDYAPGGVTCILEAPLRNFRKGI